MEARWELEVSCKMVKASWKIMEARCEDNRGEERGSRRKSSQGPQLFTSFELDICSGGGRSLKAGGR